MDERLRIFGIVLIVILIVSAFILIFGMSLAKSIMKEEKSIDTKDELMRKYPGVIFMMIPVINIIFAIVIFVAYCFDSTTDYIFKKIIKKK